MNVEDKKEEDFLTENINATKNFIFDRVSNPFIFSFIISWLISNYKIILAVFTSTSESFIFEYKIQLIHDYLELTHSLFLPLFVAVIYTFGYPYIDRVISKFSLNRKLDIRNDKNSILKTQMRTEEEVNQIHQYYQKREKILKDEIFNLRNETNDTQLKLKGTQKDSKSKKEVAKPIVRAAKKALKADSLSNENLEKRLNEIVKPISSYTQLNKEELNIILILGESTDNNLADIKETDIWKNAGTITGGKIAQDSLIKMGYIERNYIGSAYRLSLTVPGMKAYKNLNS